MSSTPEYIAYIYYTLGTYPFLGFVTNPYHFVQLPLVSKKDDYYLPLHVKIKLRRSCLYKA